MPKLEGPNRIANVEVAEMAKVSESTVSRNRDEILKKIRASLAVQDANDFTNSHPKDLTVTQKLKEGYEA